MSVEPVGLTFIDPAIAKQDAAKMALTHLYKRPIHIVRPGVAFKNSKPDVVEIYFETVSSDIQTRVPYLGPRGLHIYIPTCSTETILARLEDAEAQMRKSTVYEIENIFGFLGQVCYCGENHWFGMGWKVDDRDMMWPAGGVGVNKQSIEACRKQLQQAAHCKCNKKERTWTCTLA